MKKSSIYFLAFMFSHSVQAQQVWSGQITFSKFITEEKSLEFKEGDNFYPGFETQTRTKIWEGQVSYTGEGQKVLSAAFDDYYNYHRRQDKITNCVGSGQARYIDDYTEDRNYSVTPFKAIDSVFRIYLSRDGNYSFSVSTGSGDLDPAGFKILERRQRLNGCEHPPVKTTESRRIDSATMPSISMNISGKIDPNTPDIISGSWKGKDSEGADLSYSWEFRRGQPQVKSVIIGSEATTLRGQKVTLDGSQSKGANLNYDWSFRPVGKCLMPEINLTRKWNGPKIEFTVLCDLIARLKVSNDSEVNTTEKVIRVSSRNNWRTTFSSRIGPHLTSRLVAEFTHFGVNQCSAHPDDATSGHMIHTDAPNSSTWRDSGYTLLMIDDAGPFHEAWFVKSAELKIDRLERTNKSLHPGGEVYNLNQNQGNLPAILRLASQVKAHESIHSALINEGLENLGKDKDPAQQIEAIVTGSEDQAQFLADMKVREVETFLHDMTDENQVKQRLLKQGFKEEISIFLPTLGGEVVKKNLGPLWSIGEN